MILYPNCKINIGLRVISKRADGYHNLETIFYPILGLYDVLMITASGQFSFVQDGLAVDCPAEDNLILKCYRRMQARYPQIGNVSIRFTKRIPFGAGLGGGSSDAAHTAIALNELFELGLSREQLAEEVAPLGADCAFFIYNTPCLAEGIGEILTPIPFTLSGFRLVMLKPDIHISTREAYQTPSVRGVGFFFEGLPANIFCHVVESAYLCTVVCERWHPARRSSIALQITTLKIVSSSPFPLHWDVCALWYGHPS